MQLFKKGLLVRRLEPCLPSSSYGQAPAICAIMKRWKLSPGAYYEVNSYNCLCLKYLLYFGLYFVLFH